MNLVSVLITAAFSSYTFYGLMVVNKYIKLGTTIRDNLEHPFITNITNKGGKGPISKENYDEYLRSLTSFRSLLVSMLTWPLMLPTIKMLKEIIEAIRKYDARNKESI